ncbi:MAG: signal recognition particle protein [Pseudomonadota bacterium]
MFENLSDRLKSSVQSLTGKGRITEKNVKDTLRQVRLALLEADVALPVVKAFIERVTGQAMGQSVMTALSPGQAFIKIIHTELTTVLGGESAGLDFKTQPPLVILLAGLQGAGKTTTAAKLARRLIERDKKKTLLTSVDVHRPAAMLQLQRLAGEVGAGYVDADPSEAPVAIIDRARDEAAKGFFDVLIVDTAGRLHIDGELMVELKAVHERAGASETLFVIDAMAGQDAVNAARAFADELPLTGSIVTKADGDARGGVALSVREVTGKPILYLGVGEKTDALEAFHPERMASRILGMGDVLSLVEEVEQKVDRKKAEKLAGKLRKGKGFDLGDMRDQLQQMLNMGGMGALMDKLPIPGKIDPAALKGQADDKTLRRQIAVINSMTPHERRFPKVINGSRKRRIALGAGLQVQDVNRLLKQHMQMEKMMKRFSKGGLKRLMRGLPGGGMPGGGMPPGMR